MTLLKIVKYGDPILLRKARQVETIDEGLVKVVNDMVETMYAEPGVGLAAPQVGLDLNLAVIDLSVGERPGELIVLINPEVISTEGKEEQDEGCLSVPGFSEPVTRPRVVTVRATNLKGETFEITGEGLLARALLHELDHLNGMLYLHHLSKLKRKLITRKIDRLARAGEWDEQS